MRAETVMSTTRPDLLHGTATALKLNERAQRFAYPLSVLGLGIACYLAALAGFQLAPTETTITPIWAVTGVAIMVIASRSGRRTIWLAAAGLLVAVVVKLFLVDLAATGTIARIFSFLVVGGLLILVGYLSPLPPAREEQLESEKGEHS